MTRRLAAIAASCALASTFVVAQSAGAAPHAPTSTTAAASASRAATTATTQTARAGALAPIAHLDVNSYLGRWYQVAAVPQIFTLQCWSDTTADYALVDADTISVRNSCLTIAKKASGITGTADVVDPVTSAQLRVTFPGVPSFGNPTKPNYVVTYLSADGSLALVGDPDRTSGFVLSRTPSISAAQWREAKAAIVRAGYSTAAFWTTPQAGGEKWSQNLALSH